MATYVIGDIQGCYPQLEQLLDIIQFDPTQDKLWSVGDLVNRGSDSLSTLRFFKSLGKRAKVVLGNHDMHLLAVAHGNRERYKTNKDTLEPILQAEDRDELIDWLRHQSFLHYDSQYKVAMVHAGLPPQWDLNIAQNCAKELEDMLRSKKAKSFFQDMYGLDDKTWSPGLKGLSRLRFINTCFTRLRYCNVKGKLQMKNKNTPSELEGSDDAMPWFTHPKRASRDTTIVFGHWATLGYYSGHNVYGLDSGCVWGGRLTALRLEDKQIFQAQCPQTQNPQNF